MNDNKRKIKIIPFEQFTKLKQFDVINLRTEHVIIIKLKTIKNIIILLL